MTNKSITTLIKKAVEKQSTELDLSNRYLSECPEEVRSLKSIKILNLSQNPIQTLPFWLDELSNLERLYLGGTKISELPPQLFSLSNLKKLSLSGIHITQLPPEIKKLVNLQNLSLRGTPITKLPEEIAFLKNLEKLDLSRTPITNLPESLIKLENLESLHIDVNKIKNVPPEIVNQGAHAVINYLKTLIKGKSSPLYEAKLIFVGSGKVGKTSLMKKLIDDNFELDLKEPTTEGIGIHKWSLAIDINNKKEDFKINVWDFGGQEILRSTHQFFLTKRSLYILVWEARTDDERADFNYWLNTIKTLCDNSPVIIVLNKIDERIKLIDQQTLKKAFPNIACFHQVSVRQETGIEDLRVLIKNTISCLPHIGHPWSEDWINIRKKIEEDKRDYIDYSEYLHICRDNNLNEEDAKFLSSHLNDLGVIVHKPDDFLLKNTIILKPEWVTTAVYKLIDNKTIQENSGIISMENLETAWVNYPAEKHSFLLQLMIRFELCFEMMNKQSYIIPGLLSYDKPQFEWNKQDNLKIQYKYEFMPKGILTRFIVKNSINIYNELFWGSGVLLEYQEAKALVEEDYIKRILSITLEGDNKAQFLAIIRNKIQEIHSNYSNLTVEEMFPCNCHECLLSGEPHLFKRSLIKRYQQKGISRIRCENSFEEVNIKSILEVSEPKLKKNRPKVFISYAHEDVEWVKRICKYLKPLEREKTLDVWLDKDDIEPGSNWRTDIEKAISSSSIAILVITQDFFNSDFIMLNELPSLMKFHANGLIKIIPIIISPSSYAHTDLVELKAINPLDEPLLDRTEKEIGDTLVRLSEKIESALTNENYDQIP